jgi:hypothetical protein
VNVMADILSRRHDLTDTQLLTLFDARFPQDVPWRMCLLPPATLSALNSSLQRRRPATASWLRPGLGEPTSSTPGWLLPPPSPTIRSSSTSLGTPTSTSSSSMPALPPRPPVPQLAARRS